MLTLLFTTLVLGLLHLYTCLWLLSNTAPTVLASEARAKTWFRQLMDAIKHNCEDLSLTPAQTPNGMGFTGLTYTQLFSALITINAVNWLSDCNVAGYTMEHQRQVPTGLRCR